MNNSQVSEGTRINTGIKLYWSLWCRFYPLAITDFAMTLGDVFRPMALGRLPNAELCLAAIGVIKSLAVFFESPIIMILHASTSLSRDRASHKALWSFVLLLSGLLTSLFLVLCFEPLYSWLFIDIFGVSAEIAAIAKVPLILMIPWPALIAIRRFFQGLLVRHGYEKSMAQAGFLRLLFTVALLYFGVSLQLEGTIVAAISLVGAVAIEAIVIIYVAKRSISSLNEHNGTTHLGLPHTVASVARYYAPLGSTSLLIWAARAILIAIIARASGGMLGIAVWTAASGFVLPLANGTRMVQQVIISSPQVIPKSTFMRFSLIIGVVFLLPLFLLVFSAGGLSLLGTLLGNNDALIGPSLRTMKLLLVLPLLTVMQNTYQGFLIVSGKPWWINSATFLNVVVSLAIAMSLVHFNYPGELAAAVATLIGLMVEIIVLCLIANNNEL